MAVSEATTSTSKSAALPTFPLDAGSSNVLLYLVLLVCILLLASIGVVIWWIVKAVYQVDNGGKDDQDQDDQVQEQGKAGSVSSSKIAVKTGGGVCKNSVLTKTKTQTSGQQQQQQKKKLPARKDFGPKDFASPKNF